MPSEVRTHPGVLTALGWLAASQPQAPKLSLAYPRAPMMMSFRSTFFRGFMEGFRACRGVKVIHMLARGSPEAEADLAVPSLVGRSRCPGPRAWVGGSLKHVGN